MKLKRFNESIEDKKWSLEKFEFFLEFKKNENEITLDIKNKLEEYLLYNREILPKKLNDYIENTTIEDDGYEDQEKDDDDEDDESFIFQFKSDIDNNLIIRLAWDEGCEKAVIKINKNQIEDFIYFLNDPDTYKNSKKYNL